MLNVAQLVNSRRGLKPSHTPTPSPEDLWAATLRGLSWTQTTSSVSNGLLLGLSEPLCHIFLSTSTTARTEALIFMRVNKFYLLKHTKNLRRQQASGQSVRTGGYTGRRTASKTGEMTYYYKWPDTYYKTVR